jgi:EF hand
MKKVNVALVTALLGLSIGAPAAFAQTPAEQPKGERAHKMHERWKAADKDGDGKISRAEAAALPRINKHFDEIDANKDGFITTEELKAFHEKRGALKQKQS